MLCERCKIREANIKYTEIINGVKTEHNLCSHCAREMDFGQYTAFIDGDFPLGRLLSGLLGLADDEEETEVRGRVVCPTCGTSFDDFVENSRFGCPDCYGVFDLFINDKMKQLQGSESHKGKHPKFRSKFEKEHPDSVKKGGSAAEDSAGAEVLSFGPENFEGGGDAALAKKIRELDRKLKEALREEAYEEAGVVGECENNILGVIQIEKSPSDLAEVNIYPLKIEKILPEWQESGVRNRRMFRIAEAIGVMRGERSRKVLENLRDMLLERSARRENGY